MKSLEKGKKKFSIKKLRRIFFSGWIYKCKKKKNKMLRRNMRRMLKNSKSDWMNPYVSLTISYAEKGASRCEAVLWKSWNLWCVLSWQSNRLHAAWRTMASKTQIKFQKKSKARSNWKMGRTCPLNTLHTTANVLKDASVCFWVTFFPLEQTHFSFIQSQEKQFIYPCVCFSCGGGRRKVLTGRLKTGILITFKALQWTKTLRE